MRHSGTIYARLTYGPNKGSIVRLSIDASEPTVVAKDTDTSQIVRKTTTLLVDLFDVTWGSDGTGTVECSVTGNLNFNNKNYPSTNVNSLEELEVGNYTITCKVTSPSNKTATATKQNVNITKLAPTSVTNASGNNVDANAIYSEYDLAYFRDMVNGGQFTINGKLMNDINLSNVCSASVGNWTPIGGENFENVVEEEAENAKTYYDGIFDGEGHKLENLYINNANFYRQGVFSIAKSSAVIKNIESFGTITAKAVTGGICGWSMGTIDNCSNNITIIGNQDRVAGIVGVNRNEVINCINNGNVNGRGRIGGIAGENNGIIQNCTSEATIQGEYLVGGIAGITGVGEGNIEIRECCNLGAVTSTGVTALDGDESPSTSFTGGIVGYNYKTVTRCFNEGTITSNYNANGGIAGRNLGTVSYCCNLGNVTGKAVTGGIVGNNRLYVLYVYNKAQITNTTNLNALGGIVGRQGESNASYIQCAYNSGRVVGGSNVGGIVGNISIGTISNTYNLGELDAIGATNVGEIAGHKYSETAITNSSGTTESAMKGWSQATINTNLGRNFVKKENSLPILNITVRGITF